MKRLLPFALPAALCAMLTFSFVACGDDDSSSGYVHKNDTSASCEVDDENCECEDDDCDVSSSSKKTAASSSAKEKNDSSSAKSSSSTDSKSSSSSSLVLFESSSSLSKQLRCLLECTDDCEGETYWHGSDYQMICHDGQWLNLDSMELANAPSSSSYFDMTEQFNPDVEYGEFTDPRDGQKYRTVSLYDDVFERTLVFFVENLNYGERVPGGTVQGDSTKYCYDDDPWYCENGWGGLYTWSNAMGFPAVCDSVSIEADACAQKFEYPSGYIEPANYVQHQGICPEGWHVVNGGEWAHLEQRTGGSVAHYMGSKVAGFGKENLYGMSLLPAGEWNSLGSKFEVISTFALLWLPQQYPEYDDCAYAAMVKTNEFNRSSRSGKSQGLSIRCVKNY